MVPRNRRTGGLDSNALQHPKRFFGAIFEEFTGTGNMEIHLDRKLVEASSLNKTKSSAEFLAAMQKMG